MKEAYKFELIEVCSIISAPDFLKCIKELKREKCQNQLWYRGHSDSEKHKLVPSIARRHEYGGKSIDGFEVKQECNILHRFRRRAYPYLGHIPNEWEALFLARHYGLPTRILDWTVNPLVALYFACSENLDKPADIWGIEQIQCEKYDLDMLKLALNNDDKCSPFNLYGDPGKPTDGQTEDAIKILHPFYNSHRILAQAGVFTFHSNPKLTLDSYKHKLFCKDRLDIKSLIRWNVSADKKAEVIKELDNVGINRRTVYPDLGGLASGLWESEVLWHGNPNKAVE